MPKPSKPTMETFLFSAAHDIKNSIAVLDAAIEQILQTEPDRFASVAQMFYEVKRINGNLTHLLTLYKLGLSAYPVDIHDIHVPSMLEESTLPMRTLLDSRKIKVEIAAEDDLFWPMDEYLMTSVVSHAINNASKYTQDRILLKAEVHDKLLSLHIEDNGRGYPAAMLELTPSEISTSDRAMSGTGLGLYFSEQVARLHKHHRRQGAVKLENGGTLGGGCFVITLP
ncbi:HAMP domain-containing histidine kinase [Burkholderiaceae bacterium DAT-1]|nr:HAMP domain-containing histidine kinase [Burkholderiaceae bacterium DAT-1]